MTTTTHAGVTDRTDSTDRTRLLLRVGVVAGPLFLVAGFAQIPFRDGFDPARHPFSFLLIGPGGWLQAAVFVVTGCLFAAAGFGLRARTGWFAQVAATGIGAGMVVAGLNAPQPAFGYPAGTPAGPPAELTTASVLHGLGFAVAVVSWIAPLVALGTAVRRKGHRSKLGLIAYATAAALPVVPATSGLPNGTLVLYAVVTAAFVTTSVLFAQLASHSDSD